MPKPARPRQPALGERAGSFDFDSADRLALVRLDPTALARFFDVFFAPVNGYVARCVRDEHIAEDLTQDVFLRIHRGLPSFRPELPLRPWVFTIASNALRDHYAARGLQTKSAGLAEPEFASDEAADEVEGPLAYAERQEAAGATVAALLDLPLELRQVLVLRHYHRLPFDEIAVIGSATAEVMRQRHVRALRLLRRRLSAHGPCPEGGP